ncbi:tetratricopeptide repeat protein [Chloroflexus aggregans]|uniref:Tetratricopeptide TPR_4 n=1 Tax=Chloroflexus aggregans (strain MD-66 / DSM 9485) TaxID=326427 RepID=B8G343_CHLAD|nr:tetratricopeptide repeat protein [Chloroflexus aggregans]ACL25216.1 Tetratricopeptide TPR_4 [Chloroflexus aggregans DSM 9485]
MAGNRAIFDRAMEQCREASAKGRWEDSLRAAVRALQEFPQDIEARTAAAVALFQTNRLDKALQAFSDLYEADPNNAFYLNYIAQCYRRQGNIPAAVEAYSALADLHSAQQRALQATEALRELLTLQPERDDQRRRLAQLYEDLGAIAESAETHLELAQRFIARGETAEALSEVEWVLRLDANHRVARELATRLREQLGGSPNPPLRGTSSLRAAYPTSALRGSQTQPEQLIAEAMACQQAGDEERAIALYEQAVQAGIERADVLYSLGLLYQSQGNLKAAVSVLTRAAGDPEYALSAHFALGQVYRDLGQLPQAAQEFETTIGLVDLETIGKAEVDDLIAMYESAATIYEQLGDLARASLLYGTLAEFLTSKRWGRDRAAEFKNRAKELADRNMFAKLRTIGTGVLQPTPATPPPSSPPIIDPGSERWGKLRPITDVLRSGGRSEEDVTPEVTPATLEQLPIIERMSVPTSLPTPAFPPPTPLDPSGLDEVTAGWLELSGTYLEQGLLDAALDACMEVIHHNVEYLPIHLRMGEIYERQGRPEEALAKYQLLIETYQVRGEAEKAIDVYFRFIELSPDSINARSKLAEILRQTGRIDEAVDQSLQVANTYFRLGQTNKALEEFRRLLQWAPKHREGHAQYGLALLKLERFEAALDEFRQALELGSPDDPVALARLNITLALMGEQPNVIWDSLATVLEQLRKHPTEFAAVQAEYRAALLIDDRALLHYMLAIIQQQHEQHHLALLELEQAQILLNSEPDPMLPPALMYRATADSYIALGQAEQALEQLRKGQAVAEQTTPNSSIRHPFAIPPSRGDMVRRMAEAYAVSDDLVGAEQALLEAKKLLPYDRAIYTKLANVYFRQGKLAEALAQLDELATYYEERQQLDLAIELLEFAVQLAPNHIGMSNRLARLQLRVGKLDQGLAGLVRVSELQKRAGQLKDAVASLQEVAQTYWMLSDHERAREMYDRIVQIAPNDVDARQWLALMHTLSRRTKEAISEKKQIARIFAQQRDYDNAIAELHQIIGLDQNDLEAYFMLYDMLMRREEYGQASQLCRRMLKMPGIETERVEAMLSAANRMLEQRKPAPPQS